MVDKGLETIPHLLLPTHGGVRRTVSCELTGVNTGLKRFSKQRSGATSFFISNTVLKLPLRLPLVLVSTRFKMVHRINHAPNEPIGIIRNHMLVLASTCPPI